jgi:hypothetical protein
MKEFIQTELAKLDRGIVATPNSLKIYNHLLKQITEAWTYC